MHIINHDMIQNQEVIEVFYNNQKQKIKIQLNKLSWFIKNFMALNIDCILVEINPKDNVNES